MNALGAVAPWRFAARLARREVRRRPGRTVLVALLVAVPVFGMTVGGVLVRTNEATTSFDRSNPDGTDFVVNTWSLNADRSWAQELPDAATVATFHRIDAPIETMDGRVVDWVRIDDGGVVGGGDASPLGTDVGSAPRAAEAWVSNALADRLDLAVGDQLSLRHPSGSWRVAGVGAPRDAFDRLHVVIPGLNLDQFRGAEGRVATISRVDLVEGTTDAELARTIAAVAARVGGESSPGYVDSDHQPWIGQSGGTETLAWGWVAGSIALVAAGIIIAAAFATSARRQLVTIGQLAANGAPGRLVRTSLALQGCWTGLIGSLFGLFVGVAVLIAGRSTIERLQNHARADYRWVAFDLVVIVLTGTLAATVAALIPARTSSRVPVLAALAGRRPLGAIPRRMVPIGLAVFGLGVLLLVVASIAGGGNGPAVAAVIGGLFVLAGMCCCTPIAVDAMSRATASIGGSWRFAGRSLARTRTRTAAVATAIAVAGALAAAGSSMAMRVGDDEGGGRQAPDDAVYVRQQVRYSELPAPDYDALVDDPVDPRLASAIEQIAPAGTWFSRRVATWDPIPFNVNDPEDGGHGWFDVSIVVADEAAMNYYELTDADRDVLAEVGALDLQTMYFGQPAGGSQLGTIRIPTEDGSVSFAAAPREELQNTGYEDEFEFTGVWGQDQYMISESAARAAGLSIVETGGIFRAGAPLTVRQRDSLDDILYGERTRLAEAYADVPMPGNGDTSVVFQYRSSGVSEVAVQAAIVAAALLITLLVVAIGLSLAASETRDERDVLIAVGARPLTMRSMAGVKAVVISLTGLVLAIPTGLVPTFAVSRAIDEPFQFPWIAVGALVVVVPLLAGGAAWLVSAFAQRVRPVRMSSLAFD